MKLTNEQRENMIQHIELYARSNHLEVLNTYRESDTLTDDVLISLYVNDRLINTIREVTLLLRSYNVSDHDIDETLYNEFQAILG